MTEPKGRLPRWVVVPAVLFGPLMFLMLTTLVINPASIALSGPAFVFTLVVCVLSVLAFRNGG